VPTSKPPLPDPSLERFDRLGAFADWKPPKEDEIAFAARDLNFNDLILGIWPRDRKSRTGWEPARIWTRDRVRSSCDAIRQYDMTPTIMIWLGRFEGQIQAGIDWLQRLALETGCDVLLDLEGDWHRGRGISPDDAARMIDRGLRPLRRAGLRWGVTGLATLHRTVAPVAARAVYVLPQAYSIWKPGGAHWSHSLSTFPGTQQAAALKSWEAAARPIVMGLSCYWGGRPRAAGVPALTQPQTMRIAHAETAALFKDRPEPLAAWYWSLKWITGRSAGCKLARAFFGAKP
jgi:hypothetical protein